MASPTDPNRRSPRREDSPTPAATPTPPAATPDLQLHLHLLGTLALLAPDGTTRLAAGKPLALLAYLACARARRASRSAVADLLWGDSTDAQRRGSLRQALVTLRHAIGDESLVSDGDWLELTCPLAIDVDDFTRAIEQRDYPRAVAAWRGDFIPTFAAPGAAGFERWAEVERTRLRALFVAAAGHALQADVARGTLEPALALSQRLVDLVPDDDATWRRRFEILTLAGQSGQLLLEGSAWRTLRADEGRPLDAAIERLVARGTSAPGAGQGSARPPDSSGATAGAGSDEAAPADASDGIPAAPEFQGRGEIFTALLAAWGRAAAGQLQRLLLVGGAGMGKTRLLRELARRLLPIRVRVVTVAARQRERDDPWALLADLVARVADLPGAAGIAPSTAAALAHVVPRLADDFALSPARPGAPDTNDSLQLGRALADLLGAVADETPIALLLDDLHWGDAPSVAAIERALARIPRVPLLVVATSRFEVPDVGCGDARLALAPLALDEVEALLASIAQPGEDDAFEGAVAHLHEATHGVPYEVLRLLRAALRAGALRLADGRWALADADAFAALVARSTNPAGRLDDIDDRDRMLLVALALADVPLATALLATTAGIPQREGEPRLAVLERAGFVVRDAAARWSLAHALVADDIRAVARPDARRRMARTLGAHVAAEVAADGADLATLRRAMRLLLEGGDEPVARSLAVRWYARQRTMPDSADAFVTLLHGAGGDARFHASLRRALFWQRRWWRTPPAVAAAAVLVTLLVTATYLLQPDQLVITAAIDPVDRSLDADIPYEVPPRLQLLNRLGRPSRWRDGDSVRIAVASGSAGRMRGRTAAILRDGVAEFDSLYPMPPDWQGTLRVTLPGVRPLQLTRQVLRDELFLVQSMLNGVSLRRPPFVLDVAPRAPIDGFVRLRYTTPNRAILYALAQIATWQNPSRDSSTVRTLLAGVERAQVNIRVALTAPDTPGDYWLLWSHYTEPAGEWILSGTNWRCGRPRWGDGNDLVAYPDSVLARAVQQHEMWVPYLLCDEGMEKHVMRGFPLAGIRVRVR